MLWNAPMLYGYAKKMILADRLSLYTSAVFGNLQAYEGLVILIAMFASAFQLYMDFSGCMDIVRGASQIFGVTLEHNFRHPFFSTSTAEFWRRWHITLGVWLREYVFYPLQRSGLFRKLKKWCKNKWGRGYEKKFNLPMYAGMFLTWFLIGFWHGGKWNYIWGSGLYYWMLITASNLMMPVFQRLTDVLRINTECFSWRLFQRSRTLVLFAFGLSFFRAENLSEGIAMWQAAFSVNNVNIFWDGSLLSFGLDIIEWLIIFISFLLLIIAGLIRIMTGKHIWQWLNEQNIVFRDFILIVLILFIIIFGYYGPGVDASEFIYQQF